jgi:transposase-like protein
MDYCTKKTKKYSQNCKLSAIQKIKSDKNLSKTSRELGIGRHCLRYWLNSEEEIKQMDPHRFRKPGGGRKLVSEELEDFLIERITDYRLAKKRVNRKLIHGWAIEYSSSY